MNLTLTERFNQQVRHRTRWKLSEKAKVTAIRELFLEYTPEHRGEIASDLVGQFFNLHDDVRSAMYGTLEECQQDGWVQWLPFKEAFEAQLAEWERKWEAVEAEYDEDDIE